MTNELAYAPIIFNDTPHWSWMILLLLPVLLFFACLYVFVHGWMRRQISGMASPFPEILRALAVGGTVIGLFALVVFIVHGCLTLAFEPFFCESVVQPGARSFRGLTILFCELVGSPARNGFAIFAVSLPIIGLAFIGSIFLSRNVRAKANPNE